MVDEKMGDYSNFANEVYEKLEKGKNIWESLYDGYAETLLKNRERIMLDRTEFHEWSPLYCYLGIGKVINYNGFDLRYLGQQVAVLKVKNGKVIISTKDFDKDNKKWFYCDIQLDDADWAGDKARSFRDYFQNLSGKHPRFIEHEYESEIITEFEKNTAEDKALIGIKPVKYQNCRFHIKTALAASRAIDGIVEVSTNGGEIDILGIYYGTLTVIEVKDENKESESPEKAIKQAIAYAAFIVALLRGDKGKEWYELFFGKKENALNGRPITVNAAVAMPDDENTPQFSDIVIDNELKDCISLNYILINKTDGELTYRTSLDKQ